MVEHRGRFMQMKMDELNLIKGDELVKSPYCSLNDHFGAF